MNKKGAMYSKESFGTTLLVIAIDDFTMELLEWEPESLEMDIKEKYGDVPQSSLDRLEAARGILTTNLFYRDIIPFVSVCRTLNFKKLIPDVLYPANLYDVMWGITEADVLLGGTDGGDTLFDPEISLYVGKLLEEQGILDPPRLLNFATQTKLGISNQELAEFPDLGEIFEANQADSKKELDVYTSNKLVALFEQIGSLKLSTGLDEYNKRINKILGR